MKTTLKRHIRRAGIMGLVLVCTPAPALNMVVIAHRGHWCEAGLPQNTVEAIKRAYDIGFTQVETDFIATKSGEIICLHDRKALASMSTIVKDPKTITPADRAAINLGEKLHLPRPYRIPLLQDVLAVVPKTGVLQAEIKGYSPNYARQFDTAVKAAGLGESNIVVSSFQYDALSDFHAQYPKYKTVWLGADVGKKSYDVDHIIARAKKGGFDIVCPSCATAKKAGFARADAERIRAAGLDVRFFGVNSAQALAYAADIGITGFTCNYPCAAYGWARAIKGLTLLPKKAVEQK